MTEYNMSLLPKYFDLISNGTKIYEVRLSKDGKEKVKPNDIIIFKRRPEMEKEIKTKVEEIFLFKSFKEAINAFPKDTLGFKDYKEEDILRVYKEIYPNEEEEIKYGIIVYKLSLI
ncbi:MAG: ASCH domain-containing protein [archaeon]|nr:ASCH domain-containing protein [archaeon]